MIQPTPPRPGSDIYDAELLALALLDAELQGRNDDRVALLDLAATEHPRRVIETLANMFAVELADTYGEHAEYQVAGLRRIFLNPPPADRP
jgi:hypothetical protein